MAPKKTRKPSVSIGRSKRVHVKNIDIRDHGAKVDGETDATKAARLAIRAARKEGRRKLHAERNEKQANARPALSLGSRGPHVAYVRQRLAMASEGGDFDESVEAAVRGFQKGRGLPVTGVVDAPTWLALD
jgi:peptidoglycan hydrolase-like protein with peptidoglycan-binding domain